MSMETEVVPGGREEDFGPCSGSESVSQFLLADLASEVLLFHEGKR